MRPLAGSGVRSMTGRNRPRHRPGVPAGTVHRPQLAPPRQRAAGTTTGQCRGWRRAGGHGLRGFVGARVVDRVRACLECGHRANPPGTDKGDTHNE